MARPRTRRAAAESREKAEQAVGKTKEADQIDVKADARKEESMKPAKVVKEKEQKLSGKRRRPTDLSPGLANVRDDKRRKVQLTRLVVWGLNCLLQLHFAVGQLKQALSHWTVPKIPNLAMSCMLLSQLDSKDKEPY